MAHIPAYNAHFSINPSSSFRLEMRGYSSFFSYMHYVLILLYTFHECQTWLRNPEVHLLELLDFAFTDKPGCCVFIPPSYSRAPAFNFRDRDRLLWEFFWLYFPQKKLLGSNSYQDTADYKPLLHLLLIILCFDTTQPEIRTARQRRWPNIREREQIGYTVTIYGTAYIQRK